MNKKEIIQRIKQLERQVELLEETTDWEEYMENWEDETLAEVDRRIDELLCEEPEEEKWKPEDKSWYWYITDGGRVSRIRCIADSWTDEDRDFGNYFKTKEQAQEALDKIKAILNE